MEYNNNMNVQEKDHLDPRLTAYLLNELSPEDKKSFEEEVQTNSDLQRELDSLHSTIDTVKDALRSEPLPMGENTPRISHEPTAEKNRGSLFSHRWIAAALLIFFTVLGTSHWYFSQTKNVAHVKEEYRPHPVKNDLERDILSDHGKMQSAADQDHVEKQLTSNIKVELKDSEKVAEKIKAPAPTDPAIYRREKENAALEKPKKEILSSLQSDPKSESYQNIAPALAPKPVDQSGQQVAVRRDRSSSTSIVDGMSGGIPSLGLSIDSDTMNIAAEMSRSKPTLYSETNTKSKMMVSESSPQKKRERTESIQMYPMNDLIPDSAEEYRSIPEKSFVSPKEESFSTFSIDVDTASYSNLRRFIKNGQTPPPDAVRIEEMINYFKYDYPGPKNDSKDPFATNIEIASCPWAKDHLLARIGIKGKEIPKDKRPPLHLVFLIDVSGSMSSSNKLPLVKRGLAELVEELRDGDEIAIVVYAGSAHVHLKSTPGSETARILDSIDKLRAGGSTAGAQGIQTAYKIAKNQYKKGDVNRVILCTDGDFNVGTTNNNELEKMIEKEAKSGIYLSILGFGMGNYKDNRLSILSNKGNGNYGYIDSIAEARKLLVDQLTGTLITIAKDVKIQIEFNPNRVAGYRLIGYDDRRLAAEDFNNDKKDAGDIGAGHTVTALYEIVPVGVDLPNTGRVDESRYSMKKDKSESDGKKAEKTSEDHETFNDELMFVKLRYKLPDGKKSSLLKSPVVYKADAKSTPSADFRFASSVALFGLLLKESSFTGEADTDTVLEMAKEALGKECKDTWKNEFVDLVKQYRSEMEGPDRSNRN